MQLIYNTKSCFFGKVISIDKPLARMTKVGEEKNIQQWE